jgi:hypothetical protein
VNEGLAHDLGQVALAFAVGEALQASPILVGQTHLEALALALLLG